MNKKFKIKNIIFLTVAVICGFSFFRQERAMDRIDKEKDVQQAQLKDIEERTQRLKEENDEVQSDEYLEKLAREKLNMIKDGEFSIISKDSDK